MVINVLPVIETPVPESNPVSGYASPIGSSAEAPIVVLSTLSTNYTIDEIRPSVKTVPKKIRVEYESTRAVFMHYPKLRASSNDLEGPHAGSIHEHCLAGLHRAATALRLILRTPAE